MLVGEQMEVSHAILQRRGSGYGEDLLQALLKIGEQAEDAIVLNGSFEGTDLLDEYLIEITLEVFDFMQKIVLEEERQSTQLSLLQTVHLTLQ